MTASRSAGQFRNTRRDADQSDDYGWLHAEPFRRHLIHVAEATGLSGPVLAVVSRVPMRTVTRLMTGRVGRIRVQDAQRLLGLEPTRLRRLMSSPAEPDLAADTFAAWLSQGASVAEIARITTLPQTVVRACSARQDVEIPVVAWWRARAAVELGTHRRRVESDETPVRLAA